MEEVVDFYWTCGPSFCRLKDRGADTVVGFEKLDAC